MLKDSTFNRGFIRFSILALRSVAPLAIFYCLARLFYTAKGVLLSWPLRVWAVLEALFYFLIYLPRKWWLNLPPEPIVIQRAEREMIFERTWEVTPNPRKYLSLWFHNAPVEALRRDDVTDWLHWRGWNSFDHDSKDEEELHHYLRRTEEVLGLTFKPGSGPHKSMRVTIEPVRMQHRPLIYYILLIGSADLQFSFSMLARGYQYRALSLFRQLSSFPLRPVAWFSRHRSPMPHLSYWHLPHTSSTNLPILFIHGVGVGLLVYLDFLKQFVTASRRSDNGQTGIIVLEILSISSRITQPTLQPQKMCSEILGILRKHNYTNFILMTHSYGSVIATHLLNHPATSKLIGPMLFVDPVAFSFHPPEVAWNFLRREPTTASEIQLQYFASLDPGIAHTLTRRFIWLENLLWREDIEEREDQRCTVVLSGKDIITDTDTLARYLSRPPGVDARQDLELYETRKRSSWTGQGLEILWFPDLNHAEVFDTQKDCSVLLDVLWNYSAIS